MPEILKIEPDNIKDSVVEIRYESNMPYELILGIVYEKLKGTFKLLKQESNPSSELKIRGNQEIIDFKFEQTRETLLHDEEITVKFIPGAIIFNCLNKYLLWPKYFSKIQMILDKIYDAEIFESVNRVGLRYINEYIDSKLEDIVNFSFEFGMPGVESNKFNFRTEFDFQEHLVILHLIRNTGNVNLEDILKTIPVSYIDIDVIKQNIKIENKLSLLNVIDAVHKVEKTLFFDKFLKEEYKAKLKITHDA